MKLSLSVAIASIAGIQALGKQHPLSNQVDGRPNIIVLLTDDQDLHMDSLSYMPLLKKHITDQGTFYKRHYCTTALCCPARVTLWTGRNAHNTNVTDVFPPWGGYPKFVSQGFNENWLPVWLQKAGYSTYYTGKLFNSHNVDNWNNPRPAGWTSSDFLLDPHTYEYLNATFQRNEHPPVNHKGQYSTDLIAEKGYALLDEGVKSAKPFFLTLAPIAPHSNIDPSAIEEINGTRKVVMTTPIPAERHKHLFPGIKIPRTANFNPDQPSGVSWIKRLSKIDDAIIEYNDDFYRARLQALQAVDEIVEGLITRLTDYGILENTYIIYSTDNGYHISQHRLPPGKECGFEEDINVPLIIRGPGVPIGETDVVTAHTDLAPTILKIAKAGWGWEGLDGSPIPLDRDEIEMAKGSRQEHVNVEFWGRGIAEGVHGFSLDDGKFVTYAANNTYKALRLISKTYNLYYAVWCTNEHELYDLTTDPSQLHNLHPSVSTTTILPSLSLPMSKLLPRLDALLMVTKSCKAQTCIDPWSVIHPAGDVKTLAGALDGRFDAFYADIGNQVAFEKCEFGYVVESEGPQRVETFEEWFDKRRDGVVEVKVEVKEEL